MTTEMLLATAGPALALCLVLLGVVLGWLVARTHDNRDRIERLEWRVARMERGQPVPPPFDPLAGLVAFPASEAVDDDG